MPLHAAKTVSGEFRPAPLLWPADGSPVSERSVLACLPCPLPAAHRGTQTDLWVAAGRGGIRKPASVSPLCSGDDGASCIVTHSATSGILVEPLSAPCGLGVTSSDSAKQIVDAPHRHLPDFSFFPKTTVYKAASLLQTASPPSLLSCTE